MTGPAASGGMLFGRAVQAHQAGRLAEAEMLYARLLAADPDLVEVRMNAALAQLAQGHADRALASLDAVIARAPDLAKAHFHRGGALARLDDFGGAAAAYRLALTLQPHWPEALNNLGNALVHAGDAAGAAEAYGMAVAQRPDYAQALNNLGFAHLLLLRPERAEEALRRAVAVAPNYAEAYNNLGRALHERRRHDEAIAAFAHAIRLAPYHGEAHANLSASLYGAGQVVAAERAAREAVRVDPGSAVALSALGNAVRHLGRAGEAEGHYRRALAVQPGYVDGLKHLALCLQELGRLDEAFDLFDRHARALRGRASPSAAAIDPRHKMRHDAEQAAWAADAGDNAAAGMRVPGAAIARHDGVAAAVAEWKAAEPKIATLDHLLTPAALESLRAYCLRSDAWGEAFEGGYLGAVPEGGFTPPILIQIVEELRLVYPAIVGDLPLMYFWGFKYDSAQRGIRIHADFAAVNVNFWITPDSANRDPDHGGLVVWDVAAPADWTFERYNAADAEIRALVDAHATRRTVIPHRQNRAAIFDSDLFHETDGVDFAPGYEQRRINITLLFGRREDRVAAGIARPAPAGAKA